VRFVLLPFVCGGCVVIGGTMDERKVEIIGTPDLQAVAAIVARVWEWVDEQAVQDVPVLVVEEAVCNG
jgi:hypothetical protein